MSDMWDILVLAALSSGPAIAAVYSIAAHRRSRIASAVKDAMHEPDSGLVQALTRLTRVEAKIYNGLSEEVLRTGARVDEIRQSVARIEGRLESIQHKL